MPDTKDFPSGPERSSMDRLSKTLPTLLTTVATLASVLLLTACSDALSGNSDGSPRSAGPPTVSSGNPMVDDLLTAIDSDITVAASTHCDCESDPDFESDCNEFYSTLTFENDEAQFLGQMIDDPEQGPVVTALLNCIASATEVAVACNTSASGSSCDVDASMVCLGNAIEAIDVCNRSFNVTDDA